MSRGQCWTLAGALLSACGADVGDCPVRTTVLTAELDGPSGIAIDADAVYAVDNDPTGLENARVVRIPKNGGPVMVLATRDDQDDAIAIDDAYVYWAGIVWGTTAGGVREVNRVPKAGGTIDTVDQGSYTARLLAAGTNISDVGGGR